MIIIVIDTCLQMLLRLYQTECSPIRDGCRDCKLVEALFTAKPILHWFSHFDETHKNVIKAKKVLQTRLHGQAQMRNLSSSVETITQHEKINFVSPRDHVMFFL